MSAMLKPLIFPLQSKLQHHYVAVLLDVVARSLIGASQIDQQFQQEIQAFPVGFRFAMTVFASELCFDLEVYEVHQQKQLRFSLNRQSAPNVNIRFKHQQYAFLVLSFQESTAIAFARNRMIVDGDLSSATRLVRCLNQLEAVILPKVIARLAIKQYPNDLTLKHKAILASQIYCKVAQSYLNVRS